MAVKRTNTLAYNWSDKHKEYMRNTQTCSMNIAEGSIRSGKTTDNIFCFAHDLKKSKDKLHLATASTQPTAKIIIGDCDGYGLEHIFRGQCRWGKYKGNECLRICGKDTGYKEKIVLFCGGAKADSYKKFRGMSIGLWIATEINLHHEETIREAQRRQINADIKRFYWDLNPESPNAEIYRKFIDVYEEKSESGQLKGGFNLITFNIFDNINLSKENLDEEISKYEVGSAESAPVVKKSNQRRWWKTLAPMAAACFAVMLLANRGGVLHSEKEAAQAPAAASYAMDFTTAEEGECAAEAPAVPAGDGSVSISATAEHAPMERIAAGTEAITADQEFSACAQPVLALTLTADEAGETGFFAGMEPMEWSDGFGGYLLSWEEFETLLSLLPEAEPAEDLPIGEAVFVRIQD